MVDESCIDNELLIDLVEQHPVLWDKNTELYKNRVATQAAWKEIMIVFDPNFETKEEKTRQVFAKLIIQRWTHIRDSYSRSYKKIQGQKRSRTTKITKPYVYSKQLSFLQKIIQPNQKITRLPRITGNDSFESEDQDNNSEANESSESDSTQTDDIKATSSNTIAERISKRHVKNDVKPTDAKIMKFMDSYSNNEPKTMNRHLSFFYGILPTLDKFDEDEILEFQMGVLQLLKKIKSSRLNSE
ncbi:uncharacterized protein LOC133523313 [Cydia pomonella]|uniref:uncharacterized protein LOC133523313 n=1 Tax=Cydia pomonella TaxID=82600 RepID=UPI002ADE5523|nr:uncharacterized protein LOC133523313 [Cydia pomonella]